MPAELLNQVLRRLSAVERRVSSIVRLGRVAGVRHRPYRVQVDIGPQDAPVLTDWLSVVVPRAGAGMQIVSPLSVGEGVLVVAPGGDDVAYVLPAIARGDVQIEPGRDDTLYVSGDVVGGGKVLAGATVAAGRATGGVSLSDHVHPAPGGVTGAPPAALQTAGSAGHGTGAGVASGGGGGAPNMLRVVERVAEEHPEALLSGGWAFLDLVVEALRTSSERWGYNCKRGDCRDVSRDVVTYYRGDGDPQGSTDVAIIDVIVGYKGPTPRPEWLDLTEATHQAGTIGRWKFPREGGPGGRAPGPREQ